MAYDHLRYLGRQQIPDDKSEVRLFSVMQNETLRLPAFLRHYRELGVKRFFIIDNQSSDATVALLTEQPDVHLFQTDASFAASRHGVNWMNGLLSRYGIGHWCVLADADELLVYPDYENIKLPQFCAQLLTEGAEAMQAILLDMYSDQPLSSLAYSQGQDLIEACPYFDSQYQFVPRSVLPWQERPFPPTEPLGGPRTRLFFADQYLAPAWRRLFIKLVFRLLRPLATRGWLQSGYLPHPAPQLFKLPLVYWRPETAMITNHRTTPLPLARSTGALLHFKYLQDFLARTTTAIANGQHYGGSIEYQRYAAMLKAKPNVTFMYRGSRRFSGSMDLAAAGLISAHNSHSDVIIGRSMTSVDV